MKAFLDSNPFRSLTKAFQKSRIFSWELPTAPDFFTPGKKSAQFARAHALDQCDQKFAHAEKISRMSRLTRAIVIGLFRNRGKKACP